MRMKPFYRRPIANTNRDPQNNRYTFCTSKTFPHAYGQQLPARFQRLPSSEDKRRNALGLTLLILIGAQGTTLAALASQLVLVCALVTGLTLERGSRSLAGAQGACGTDVGHADGVHQALRKGTAGASLAPDRIL